MTKILNSNEYGDLDIRRLEKFESRIGCQLPKEYRSFLLTHNGGKPQPSDIMIGTDDFTGIHGPFYGLHHGPDFCRLDDNYKIFKNRIPDGLLAIAGDDFGNQICIGIKGKDYGQIYFWDHEKEEQNFALKLAPSFIKFLESLVEWAPPGGESQVLAMIENNDVEGICKLLSDGFNIEAPVPLPRYMVEAGVVLDRSLLEEAALHNKPDIVELLFKKGAKLKRALELSKDHAEHNDSLLRIVALLKKLYQK